MCMLYIRYYGACRHLAGSRAACQDLVENFTAPCSDMAMGSPFAIDERCDQCEIGNRRWKWKAPCGSLEQFSRLPSDFVTMEGGHIINGRMCFKFRVCGYLFSISFDTYGCPEFGDLPQPVYREKPK